MSSLIFKIIILALFGVLSVKKKKTVQMNIYQNS